MSRATWERKKKGVDCRGVCHVCGCTDREACELHYETAGHPIGCAWYDRAHTLCTACVGVVGRAATDRRDTALSELQQRIWIAKEELAELIRRATALKLAKGRG